MDAARGFIRSLSNSLTRTEDFPLESPGRTSSKSSRPRTRRVVDETREDTRDPDTEGSESGAIGAGRRKHRSSEPSPFPKPRPSQRARRRRLREMRATDDDEIKQAIGDLHQCNSRLDHLMHVVNLDDGKSIAAALKRKLAFANERVKRLERELLELEDRNDRSTNELKGQLKDERALHDSEKERMESKIEDLERAAKRANDKIEQAVDEKNAEKLKNSSLQKINDELRLSLEAAKRDADANANQVAIYAEKIETLQVELSRVLERGQREIDELRREYAADIRDKERKARASYDEALAKKVAEFDEKLRRRDREYKALQVRLEKTVDEKRALSSAMRELENSLAEFRHQLNESPWHLEQEIKELKDENGDLEQGLDNAKRDLEMMRASYRSLVDEKVELKSVIDRLNKNVRMLEEMLAPKLFSSPARMKLLECDKPVVFDTIRSTKWRQETPAEGGPTLERRLSSLSAIDSFVASAASTPHITAKTTKDRRRGGRSRGSKAKSVDVDMDDGSLDSSPKLHGKRRRRSSATSIDGPAAPDRSKSGGDFADGIPLKVSQLSYVKSLAKTSSGKKPKKAVVFYLENASIFNIELRGLSLETGQLGMPRLDLKDRVLKPAERVVVCVANGPARNAVDWPVVDEAAKSGLKSIKISLCDSYGDQSFLEEIPIDTKSA